MALVFLCTRVKALDTDDYKKLACIIRYLHHTASMPLTLEADSLQHIKWLVDASYAVNAEMKSKTGGTLSLGKGVIYGTSTRQKINTRNSTESKLVAVNGTLPQVLWTCYFLESQVYGTIDSIAYQDNQSWKIMDMHQAASTHATSTSAIFLLLTGLMLESLKYNTVPQL